jgi:hypothetical protein
MHLHDIEAWILEESPRFAAAVADYYENNGRNIALFATAHMDVWRGAETYTGTNPHVLSVRQWYRAQIGQPVAKGDSAYLYKCARALDYLIDKAAGKTSKSDYLTPERFVIDAYHWLRVVAKQDLARSIREKLRRVVAEQNLDRATQEELRRVIAERGLARPTREELRQEAKCVWAYVKICPDDRKRPLVSSGQVSSSRLGYQAFKDKARGDWRFRERVEAALANAERVFPSNHFDRILRRVGLDDLEAKIGRPRKGRKGASVRQVALVKEKKFPKTATPKGKYL